MNSSLMKLGLTVDGVSEKLEQYKLNDPQPTYRHFVRSLGLGRKELAELQELANAPRAEKWKKIAKILDDYKIDWENDVFRELVYQTRPGYDLKAAMWVLERSNPTAFGNKQLLLNEGQTVKETKISLENKSAIKWSK